MSRVTEWHDGKRSVPGTPGIYEREVVHLFNIQLSYWTGEYWCVNFGRGEERRAYTKQVKSNYQDLPFRGLVDNPKEK